MSEYEEYGSVGRAEGRTWVPLSPEQIRARSFRENQLGRRGYRREDVDTFLTRAADEVQRWNAAYTHAEREIIRLRNYFKGQGIDAAEKEVRAPSTEAVNVLAQAQAHADQLIAAAQAHARAMQYDARDQAEAIVMQARQEADRAAHAYRAQAGEAYTPDREQVERLGALGRSILTALNGATTQMDGASAQMRAISEAFANELAKATSPVEGFPVPYQ
jgi:DivIVA domain-containing protein